MRRARSSTMAIGVTAALIAAACGPAPVIEAPKAGDPLQLAKATTAALEVEATKSAGESFDAWQKVLELATASRATPLAAEATMRALDGITGRDVNGLALIGDATGAMHRVAGGLDRAIGVIDAALARDGARDLIIRRALTVERMRLAGAKGDAAAFAHATKDSACATEATIVGPFPVPVLGALVDAGPVDDGAIAATYPARAGDPAAQLTETPHPVKTDGRGCSIDTTGTMKAPGLRYAIVDVDVPSPQTITIGLTTSLPSKVLVGGKEVASLSYGDAVTQTTRTGTIQVKAAGRVRVVAKLAAYFSETIGLRVVGEDGAPLPIHAASGASPAMTLGDAHAAPVVAIAGAETSTTLDLDTRLTLAAGLESRGESRAAEALLEPVVRPNGTEAEKPSPVAALLYAETLGSVLDLPFHRKLERQRAAYEAVLASWPTSWEAIIGHAEILATQRQGGAGAVEAIDDVQKRRAEIEKTSTNSLDNLVDVYLAIVGDQVLGVRDAELARLKPKLAGTWIGWRLERLTAKETDDVTLRTVCSDARFDWGRWDCVYARLGTGDDKGALEEIERLRTLTGAARVGGGMVASITLRARGREAAKAAYDALDLYERTSALARELVPAGDAGIAWLRTQLRELGGDPHAILDVLAERRADGTATAGDVAASYDARTRSLIDADRKSPAFPDAGVVILDREEKYELDAEGFLHVRFWDVRRLSGTADVDQSASARTAAINGAGWTHTQVHRVFKADGRVVEPDRIDAAQAGAELSQVEPGDYVEMVAEGLLATRSDGALELDSADLLPQRQAVVHASIMIATPTSAEPKIWAHSELGAPVVASEGTQRLSTWTLDHKAPRRIERGQAGLDAAVCVRMSTWSWAKIGAYARDAVLAETEALPDVDRWVDATVGSDRAPTIDLLGRLVRGAKRAIPRVGFLPMLWRVAGPKAQSARTMLLDAQGSRVELVKRALDRLGVQSEIVWAEQAPYSSDAAMVPKSWRFTHALLVAHVASKVGEPMKPVWLDLDVEGMPPAPGHTSPELRGRLAITTTGEIIPVPANADEEPDVATVELTVDEHGRAKGTLALLLKGRDAHDLTNILEELAGEDRVNALKGYVLGWLPGADVLEVTASQDGWWFVLTAKVELSSLLALDGKRLAIPGAPALHSAGRATTLGATYAAQAKRTTALTIRDAIQYRVHRVIHLPPSTSFTTPLPSLDVTEPTSGMRATRKVSIDGDTMIDDVAFALPTCVVSIEAFPAWTKEARIIDDGLSSVVRVTSPSLSTESPKPRAAAKPTRGPAPKPR